jgi:hypothetical protein
MSMPRFFAIDPPVLSLMIKDGADESQWQYKNEYNA